MTVTIPPLRGESLCLTGILKLNLLDDWQAACIMKSKVPFRTRSKCINCYTGYRAWLIKFTGYGSN